MEDKRYTQKVKNDDKIFLRNAILVICAVALAVVLIGAIASIGNKRYMDLVYYSIAFVVVLLMQFSTIFLCYVLIIIYENGKLSVIKSYSGLNKTVFDTNIKDIEIEKFSQDLGKEKVVVLSSKSCGADEYMIKLSCRKYLLNLDDYMYSLLGVEDDLS
ncbi:MAG: hypothetical protein K2K24_02405 [Clostridia bacterium]|nr:hypothetical protein [Clostridia bacterium]